MSLKNIGRYSTFVLLLFVLGIRVEVYGQVAGGETTSRRASRCARRDPGRRGPRADRRPRHRPALGRAALTRDARRYGGPDTAHRRLHRGGRPLAGWVDAVVGGGGLVQLPALLLGSRRRRPAQILATNKFSSIFGTTASASPSTGASVRTCAPRCRWPASPSISRSSRRRSTAFGSRRLILCPMRACSTCSAWRRTSGRDVRLLCPFRPDKWLPFLAAHLYWHDALAAGVKIYQYTHGFLHAKILIADDDWSSVGSANFDNRSLHLNFEMVCIMESKEVVANLEEAYLHNLANSIRVDPVQFEQRGFITG